MNCRSKMPAVHHIHVKIGNNVYTLAHDGACVDVLSLLNQIAFLQDTELENAKTGARK